jgi:peptidoglycan hydrolase-like protein with peptidoglycan-binding domain
LRVFILALSLFGILVSTNVAYAGPSTADRSLQASADPMASEATQETEDQIGLDKRKRREVQRRLTELGFATKISGRFGEPTRGVITRWQAARGYPETGFLNSSQHQALLSESVSAAQASLGSNEEPDDTSPARRRGGGSHRHSRGGGPGASIGGMVGGLFGRR